MKRFLDTSVLVAAFLATRPGHESALSLLSRCTPQDSFCGAHSLAEFYATLTGREGRNILPDQCAMFIEGLVEHISLVTLSAPEYFAEMGRAADAGLSGGIIYDALLLACARKSKADAIFTFNTKHFLRIAPDLANRIRTP
jgi:predicted nucleic acid-binding protein